MKSALEIQETEGKLSRNTGNRRRILSKYRKEKENSLEIQETEGHFSKNVGNRRRFH